LLAGSVGFILGSAAGREPYERLERAARQIAHRPEVQEKIHAAKQEASKTASNLSDNLQSKVTSTVSGSFGTRGAA
jgi:hypothetical protein